MTTVTGPVSSAGLGLTLTHEHLSNDLRAAVTEPDDPSLAFLRHARTEPGLAWLLRDSLRLPRPLRLDDAPAVLADLRAFAGPAAAPSSTSPRTASGATRSRCARSPSAAGCGS